MIKIKENKIWYYTDDLCFNVTIDEQDDVTFFVYSKKVMDFIDSYIITEYNETEFLTREVFLKYILKECVCNYYDKQKNKFLSKMILFNKENADNE